MIPAQRPPTIDVRHERPGDEAAIRLVNDLAFGQFDESRIVDAVRAAGKATVSLVATGGQDIVGHILFTPVTLGFDAQDRRLLGLGPIAVLPEHQRHGVGSLLIRAGLSECASRGAVAIVVLGHPSYYPRFGFQPASRFGLRCEYDVPDDVFMALELAPGSLGGMAGTIRYVPEFGAF
jgi:putative acetyltransferase